MLPQEPTVVRISRLSSSGKKSYQDCRQEIVIKIRGEYWWRSPPDESTIEITNVSKYVRGTLAVDSVFATVRAETKQLSRPLRRETIR
jgi:hypothetical protein